MGEGLLARRVLKAIVSIEPSAPPSPRILEMVNLQADPLEAVTLHDIQLTLADLSLRKIVRRSKRGLYRRIADA